MSQIRPHIAWAVLAFFLLLLLSGCVASPPRPPVEMVADRSADPSRRLAALNEIGSSDRDLAALSAIVWSDREPDELRIAALEHLIAHEEKTFARTLNRRITDIDRWPVLQHVLDLAVDRGWDHVTGAIVRSWARRSTAYADADRPERAALAALHADRPVQDVLLGMLTHLEGKASLSEQVAAWAVLVRLKSPEDLRAMLDSLPVATPLMADLQAAAQWLDVLPPDREAVLWLMALRGRDDGDWWRQATGRIDALTPVQRQGLELRHLPVLMAADPSIFTLDSAALEDRIRQRLRLTAHAIRTDYGDTGGPASEAFEDQVHHLAWGDLVAIHLILDAMHDPGLIRQWFVQADADLLDRSTEFGGVLRRDEDGRWHAAEFRPTLRAHDRKFYSSPALIDAMYDGIAHYHFHAQKHRNADFAGPGGGDFGFADRLRPHALVLTFLDRGLLNVDYYLPDRVVVDLGTIRR